MPCQTRWILKDLRLIICSHPLSFSLEKKSGSCQAILWKIGRLLVIRKEWGSMRLGYVTDEKFVVLG
ncbi:MAG: hypothetical protein LBJ13_03740, partial [Puniceicoccales bacterium]|nr:hypothetical protein [Puniceicoccales bacterium]